MTPWPPKVLAWCLLPKWLATSAAAGKLAEISVCPFKYTQNWLLVLNWARQSINLNYTAVNLDLCKSTYFLHVFSSRAPYLNLGNKNNSEAGNSLQHFYFTFVFLSHCSNPHIKNSKKSQFADQAKKRKGKGKGNTKITKNAWGKVVFYFCRQKHSRHCCTGKCLILAHYTPSTSVRANSNLIITFCHTVDRRYCWCYWMAHLYTPFIPLSFPFSMS